MRIHIIVDIEATCWKGWENRELMEIIEIGAIKIDQSFEIVDEFVTFVQPVKTDALSKFCTELTSITQADVDNAPLMPLAYKRFIEWIDAPAFVWYSWGGYDATQLRSDLNHHDLTPHPSLDNHVDLRRSYAKFRNLEKEIGLRKALRKEGIEFVGRHHRGIDDARHSACLAQLVLRGRAAKKEGG